MPGTSPRDSCGFCSRRSRGGLSVGSTVGFGHTTGDIEHQGSCLGHDRRYALDSWKEREPHLAPVPCGPFAKAWLKRAISGDMVSCRVTSPVELAARCNVKGRDLGLEMLRVGWALVARGEAYAAYHAAERYARSARYGLWGTYVLNPDEWQMRAVDRTLARRPVADRNLLKDRQSEITPPFADWRNRDVRNDR